MLIQSRRTHFTTKSTPTQTYRYNFPQMVIFNVVHVIVIYETQRRTSKLINCTGVNKNALVTNVIKKYHTLHTVLT